MLADLRMPGIDGQALLDRLPASMPAIIITGLDIEQPPRAAALLAQGRADQGAAGVHHPPCQQGGCDDRAWPVLLVDDDEAKRYVMATWLRRAGHTVTEAGTGAEALASGGRGRAGPARRQPAGHERLRRLPQIKGDPRTAAIPVIQVSATADRGRRPAHGLTQGADAYLIDPAEPEELLATVDGRPALLPGPAARGADAALLSVLTSVTWTSTRRETFDGLARAAAAGAARIFSVRGRPPPRLARRPAPPDIRLAGSLSRRGAAVRPPWPTASPPRARPPAAPARSRAQRRRSGCA